MSPEGGWAWLQWPNALGPYALVALGAGVIVFFALCIWVIWRLSSSRTNVSQHAVGIVGQQHAPSAAVPSRSDQQLRSDKDITEDILKAEKHGDVSALAALYLEKARFELENGAPSAASEPLRKSATLAAKHDLKKIHAEARLELAGLAEASEDMTTACEHWQIARTLFHELDLQDQVTETDQLMLGNGCPTDWVLTDF